MVSGRREIPLEFVAAKMLVMRLRIALRADSSAANASRCAVELHDLYAENLDVGSAKRDLTKLGLLR